jgi:hypothetical protein
MGGGSVNMQHEFAVSLVYDQVVGLLGDKNRLMAACLQAACNVVPFPELESDTALPSFRAAVAEVGEAAWRKVREARREEAAKAGLDESIVGAVDLDIARPPAGARVPAAAKRLGRVGWNWSPVLAHSVVWHLDWNRRRQAYVLWLESERRTEPVAALRAGNLRPSPAAMAMLTAYYRVQMEVSDLDAFHGIHADGLLTEPEILAVADSVWGREMADPAWVEERLQRLVADCWCARALGADR